MSGIRTLADIEYLERMPLQEQELPENTYDMIMNGAVLNPEKTALTFFLRGTNYKNSVTFTYRTLVERINQTANLFHDLGVRETDVVSIILPNLPETFFSIYGGEAEGIVNPINPNLDPARIADIMNAAGTRVLVTLAPFPNVNLWNKVASILNQVPSLHTILQVDLVEYLFGMKKQVARWLARGKRMRFTRGGLRILDFNEALVAQPGNRLVSGRIPAPDDLASCYPSEHQTGRPKLVLRTHHNEVVNAWASAGSLGIEKNGVHFCGMPLYQAGTVAVTGLMSFGKGASTIIGTPEGFRGDGVVEHFWEIVEQFRITMCTGVPTVYRLLRDVPVGSQNIRSLKLALCSQAPMPKDLLDDFEHRTGLCILDSYNLAEGTGLCAVNPPAGRHRIGSVGLRLPYQHMKSAQLNTEGRYMRDSKPDEVGTVILRGPNVCVGYMDERHNLKLWVDTGDGQGPWLNSGNLGSQDANGYFRLMDPSKDIYIRSEHDTIHCLIEDVLQKHPAVALVAAVGRPDDQKGQVPVAYVQLKPGHRVTLDELLSFIQTQEPMAVPRVVRIIDEMPLTEDGKILKSVLVGREIQDVYELEVKALMEIASVDVGVGPDPRHGMAAAVQVISRNGETPAQVKARIDQVLGRYSIAYEVVVEEAQVLGVRESGN